MIKNKRTVWDLSEIHNTVLILKCFEQCHLVTVHSPHSPRDNSAQAIKTTFSDLRPNPKTIQAIARWHVTFTFYRWFNKLHHSEQNLEMENQQWADAVSNRSETLRFVERAPKARFVCTSSMSRCVLVCDSVLTMATGVTQIKFWALSLGELIKIFLEEFICAVKKATSIMQL